MLNLYKYCLLFNIYLVGARQNVSVLIMYSSDGGLEAISDTLKIAKFWSNHLAMKQEMDNTWPFNANVEYIDVHSNLTIVRKSLINRIKRSPKVTGIIGPEIEILGYAAGDIAAQYGIPCILASTNPDAIKVGRPNYLKTSYLIQPAVTNLQREVIDLYATNGVKTMVIVTLQDGGYDEESCAGGALLAISKGISILTTLFIPTTGDVSNVRNIIIQLRDNFNPDAVLWCDWAACTIPENVNKFNPMQHFKALNYLPKALAFLDCLDQVSIQPLVDQNLFFYVSQGQYFNAKLTGLDYTEDATPYSSVFRQKTPANFTVIDQLTLGQSTHSPPSIQLFMKWYATTSTSSASYIGTLCNWAAFDVLEAALYKATSECNLLEKQQPNLIITDEILVTMVNNMLGNSQVPTPIGRIVFDVNGVNTAMKSIAVQLFPNNKFSDIVAPSEQQTSNFIYPMPTWNERIYIWKLIDTADEKASVIIACICTLILVIIAITIIIHRNHKRILMMNYIHILSMLIAAIMVCWSFAIVWQDDFSQTQCDIFIWVIILPISYIIGLINFKAYRLSFFLSGKNIRAKSFTHNKVIIFTMIWTIGTTFLLGILVIIDPYKLQLSYHDPHRPALNRYICNNEGKTGIISLIVVYHIIATIYCVIAVRNGMDAFRDGVVIKEAFFILYIMMIITLLTSLQNISNIYLIRTYLVSFGITFFCLRLMFSRCIEYWIPKQLQPMIGIIQKKVIQPLNDRINPISNHNNNNSYLQEQISNDDRRGSNGLGEVDYSWPIYSKEIPTDINLNEMMEVMRHIDRSKAFHITAEKCHCVENIDFLEEVIAFQQYPKVLLLQHTAIANAEYKQAAQQLYEKFIIENAEKQINISAQLRNQLYQQLEDWRDNNSLITTAKAKELVKDDHLKSRVFIFEKVFREVSILLYQNVWSRFREEEIESMAAGLSSKNTNDGIIPINI